MNTFHIVDKLGGWDNILGAFGGWSIGYEYTLIKNKEDEVKQGKNYCISTFLQMAQVGQLATLVHRVSSAIPNNPYKRSFTIGCNLIPFVCIPLFGLAAAVKMGKYSQAISVVSAWSKSYIKLPARLSHRTTKILCLIAEHTGKLVQAAFVANTIALIAIGRIAEGGAVLAAIGFSLLDQSGWIPRKISLWTELYMHHITSVGMLVTGIVIVKIMSLFHLIMTFFNHVSVFLHYQIDSFVRNKFKLSGPSLKQIDAPVIQKTDFTYEVINKILNAEDKDFEINYPHCSKMTLNFDKLKKDNQFEGFLKIFDSIPWENRFPIILKKIGDDDRFLDMLRDHFPHFNNNRDTNPTAFFKQLEMNIEQLAIKKGMSKEKYTATWMRDQMIGLMNILKGKVRPKGMQQDLAEAIEHCAIILPHLNSSTDQIEKEDSLMKLAIEGGKYCARGTKRASSEIVYGIVERGIQGTHFDPNKNYEMRCLQALQNARLRAVENIYASFSKLFPQKLTKDVHSFDLYRTAFTLGVYPLTSFERKKLDFLTLMNWELFSSDRMEMYDLYFQNIDDAIKINGEIHFANYMVNMIHANSLLTDAQKTEIMEKYTERNNDLWSTDETNTRFHKLLFVKLGILKLK